MKLFLYLAALVVFALGVIGGIYTGVWLMFVGGIVDVITSVKAQVGDPLVLACGIVKIAFAAPVGWLVFIACSFVSGVLGAIAND